MDTDRYIEEILAFDRFYVRFLEADTRVIDTSVLSIGEVKCLLLIDFYRTSTVKEIANTLGADIAYFSRLAKHLCDSGYLAREQNPEDHRSHYLKLTELGKTETEAQKLRMRSRLRQRVAGLSESNLRKLAAHMTAIQEIMTSKEKDSENGTDGT